MWYIFENRIVQGHQKLYSHVPNTKIQIQIHKYTNTADEEVPERPSIWYIFETRIQSIIYVSSVYRQCILSTSSAHHQRIISTSSVHHCSVFIAELRPVYCCLFFWGFHVWTNSCFGRWRLPRRLVERGGFVNRAFYLSVQSESTICGQADQSRHAHGKPHGRLRIKDFDCLI